MKNRQNVTGDGRSEFDNCPHVTGMKYQIIFVLYREMLGKWNSQLQFKLDRAAVLEKRYMGPSRVELEREKYMGLYRMTMRLPGPAEK